MNRTIFRFVILLSLGIVILVPASAQSQDCEPVVLPYYVLFDNQEWTPYWNWPHIWENPSQYPSPMIEDNCWRVNKDDNGIELVSEVDYIYFYTGSPNYCIYCGSAYSDLPGGISQAHGYVSLLVTPGLDSPPQSVSFSIFSAGIYDHAYLGDSLRKRIVVGYIADTSNWKGSFVGIDTIELAPERLVWERFTVTGFDDMPAPYHVAFFNDTLLQYPSHSLGVYQGPASIQYRYYIDSLLIERRPMIHDTIMLFDTVCQGEPYTENGFNVTSVQTSASGMLTLQDSIVEGNLVHHRILHLTVLPEYNTLLYEYISPGDTVYHDGTIYSTTGQYTISYTASNGCDSVVTLHILYTPGEEPVLQLWLPNAFSPGQNGINDEFLPVFNYPDLVEEYQMEIYNRWGILVFRTEEMTRGWDGDGLTGGVYVCRVIYKPKGGKEKVVIGNVTIFK